MAIFYFARFLSVNCVVKSVHCKINIFKNQNRKPMLEVSNMITTNNSEFTFQSID